MLRQDKWKYIKYMGYAAQLFDLEADPWEAHDVAPNEPAVVARLDRILEANVDCTGIDARAKAYDRENFVPWRAEQKAAGTYEDTMAHVYSGFDRQCIENISPWREEDEDRVRAWLGEA